MRCNLIVAYDLNRGIGFQGQIPWSLPDDLKLFRQLTTQPKMNCVVMGRKTWESLPLKYRPLPNRINIIISTQLTIDKNLPLTYICPSFEALDILLPELEIKYDLEGIFLMGGCGIYQEAINRYQIDRLYITQVLQKYTCDVFLPAINLYNYELIESQMRFPINETDPLARYQVYQYSPPIPNSINTEEQHYLNILNQIMTQGQYRDDRTQVGTLALFQGLQLRFDLRKGFPLLTTKRTFFRGAVAELLFFLRGQTDNKILQKSDVHIWDGNSSREYLDSVGLNHLEDGDLGAIYGFQWRHFGAEYLDCHTDYTGKGDDQIQSIIDLITKSPTSRRILMSAWNPSQLKNMSLPPCHLLYQFYVDLERRTLSCSMYQRSGDQFLGVPFNIASVALLTSMIAKTCDLEPDHITITFGDSHIYLNHLRQIKEQLTRTPRQFPQLTIKKKCEHLEDYEFSDFEISNYNPYGKLVAPMAV